MKSSITDFGKITKEKTIDQELYGDKQYQEKKEKK